MTLRKQLLASTVLCAALCGAAHAAPAPAASSTIEEVIVTAQKRSESLTDVGMAITAISGNQLQELGVRSVAQLTKVDPSFVLTNSNYGAPVYSIRGIFFNNFALAAAPTVSVYTDEVPYAYPSMTKGATFDLERVEILKGPQGTLYGQNSTAGAINYIAAKPTKSFSAGVEASYGSYNATVFDGFVSGPINDTLSVRLAVNAEKGGAWQKSISRDDTLGDKDTLKGRLLLDWRPNDRLKVDVNLTAWSDRSDFQAGQFYLLAATRPAYLPVLPGLTSATRPPTKSNRWAEWIPGIHPGLNEESGQGAVRVNYRITDDIDLTYIGSYQSFDQENLHNNGGTTTPTKYIFAGRVTNNSQEARLSGTLMDGKLKWLSGLNYQDAITNERQDFDLLGGTASYSYVALGYTMLPYRYTTVTSRDDTTSKAAYANATFDPVEEISFHVGARYTETDIDHVSCIATDAPFTQGQNEANRRLILAVPGAAPYRPVAAGQCVALTRDLQAGRIIDALKEDNIAWRVGLDWKPRPGTIVYGSISKGYKAGNFPTSNSATYTSLIGVTQESLIAYELGTRTRFLDNRVAIDASVFYYDYKDKQVEGRMPTILGVSTPLVNLPKVKVLGADVDLTLRPIENLVLHAKTSYLDSAVVGDTPGFDGFGTAVNFRGASLAQAPLWSVILDGLYTWNLTDNLSAFAGATYSYRSRATSQIATRGVVTAAYTVDTTEVKEYSLVGLRIGMETLDGHWRFQVTGDNVTNAYYWTQMLRQSDTVIRYMGRPRSFMATVAYKY